MDEGKPALVTGACGFLGRHLVRALLQQGRKVTAAVRNSRHMADFHHPNLEIVELPDFARVNSEIKLQENLSLFHLAGARAKTGIKTAQFRTVNVDATLALAEAAREARVRRFVYVSTALIFAGDGEQAASEIDLDPRKEFDNPYLQTRLEAALALQPLASRGLDLVSVCPSIIFGPDHPRHPNRITQQMRRLLRTGIDVVVGGGSRARDMVYVDDVVAGILAAERSGAKGETFILGGEAVSHRKFNAMVLELAGRRRRLRASIPLNPARRAAALADLVRRNGNGYGYSTALQSLAHSWAFSSRKAVEELAYSPRSLEAGIRATVDWLEEGTQDRA
ncbi:MAG: NAD-dependent epimerase/dehydratase family protein [Anaerolineales bacterium]